MSLDELRRELDRLKNPKQAALLQRFFKTGKGEYGEGDVFLGISVPEQRKVAKRHAELSLVEIAQLLNSKLHEHRLVGLLILTQQFEKADEGMKKKIFGFYLKNSKKINNWDLVDLSAPRIVGAFLLDKDRKILYALAKSANLWERRISIISTLAFIVKGESKDALAIAEMHLKDRHDLIHKATGWMLREVGKRCGEEKLEEFLKKHSKQMLGDWIINCD